MPARFRSIAVLSALVVLWAGLFLAAQDIKVPPAPDRWATDEAGFLSRDTVASLDARLEAYEKETGHQVLVYVGRTTGGVTIEEWAVKVFEAWKVGRKGLDDGLVLFIMAGDRKVRIEVGYGLEERVPDARASRIINEVLLPGFRSNQPDAAVSEAVANLLSLVSGRDEGSPPQQGPPGGQRGKSAVSSIFVVAAVIFFLILLITNPSLALWLLFSIFSGGRGGGRGGWGGGGGFGGGGFSGGGGRSGGGGASGSW
jgi:uncharacterized protein